MLIAGLIALLSMMLGETTLPFLLPKEEKSINKVIKDESKKKQLKIIAKGIEKKEDEYKENRKEYRNELEELNLNRSTTPEQFLVVTGQIHRVNMEAFDFMVKVRLTIGELLTVEEWDAIIADGKKRYHKTESKYEKAYPDFEKTINKIINRVEKTISDKEKAKLISSRIKKFSKLTLENSKKIASYNIYDHPVLSNIRSTEEELKAIRPEILALRNEVVSEYIAIHNLLAANTTEEEWPKVVKKVNKLF